LNGFRKLKLAPTSGIVGFWWYIRELIFCCNINESKDKTMANSNIELRTLTFLDSLQPQLAHFISKNSTSHPPKEYDAMLIVEMTPAMEIHSLVDSALKHTQVRLGALITERYFGQLFVQHADQGEVIEAGREIMRVTGLDENDRAKVDILTNKIIRNIEPDHAVYFNASSQNNKNKVEPGESVLIMETTPASYLAISCNEALKAANIKLIELRSFGATGRLVMSGPESEIDSAAEAALKVIDKLNEMRANKNYKQLD
jgi:ethanolamine utilization microcompartment shell protein EutS